MRTYHVEINFQILLPRIRKDFAGWQHQPFVHEDSVACRPRLPWPSWPPWTSMQGITQSNLSLTTFSIKCVQTDKLGVCLFCLCLCTITNIYNYVPIVAGSHSMPSASFMISITAQTLRRRAEARQARAIDRRGSPDRPCCNYLVEEIFFPKNNHFFGKRKTKFSKKQ